MKFAVMLCAALGGLLFGYDTTVINASLFQMKDHFGFDEHSWIYALIVAIALAGAFVGAFVAGFISARFGRRPCLVIADILFIVGSALMAAAPNWEVVIVSRVIVGFAVGISSATIPVYLAEVTSPKHRGATIVLNNMFITGGQFIAAGFAAIMVIFTSKNVGWRVAIGVGAVPAIIQIIGIVIWLPESPRWLMSRGKAEKAESVAKKYDVDLQESGEVRSVSMNYAALITKEMRYRVFFGCMLQAIQQFSGINTVMYYSAVILKDAGFEDPKMPVILSVPLAFMNALCTVVAIFTVDRFGRRTLLLASSAGCFCVTLVITIIGFLLDKQIPYSIGGWLFLALLAVFLACFAPGVGSVPWVVMGEIFPQHIRTTAASAATMTNWAANAVVSQVFPLLLGAIGVGGTFAIICGLLLLSTIFLYFCAIETKGMSLEDIDNLFRKRAGFAPISYKPEEEDLEFPVDFARKAAYAKQPESSDAPARSKLYEVKSEEGNVKPKDESVEKKRSSSTVAASGTYEGNREDVTIAAHSEKSSETEGSKRDTENEKSHI